MQGERPAKSRQPFHRHAFYTALRAADVESGWPGAIVAGLMAELARS